MYCLVLAPLSFLCPFPFYFLEVKLSHFQSGLRLFPVLILRHKSWKLVGQDRCPLRWQGQGRWVGRWREAKPASSSVGVWGGWRTHTYNDFAGVTLGSFFIDSVVYALAFSLPQTSPPVLFPACTCVNSSSFFFFFTLKEMLALQGNRRDPSSQTRDWTWGTRPTPGLEAWSLNHWTSGLPGKSPSFKKIIFTGV